MSKDCPVTKKSPLIACEESSCPINHKKNSPILYNESTSDFLFNQEIAEGQVNALSVSRDISSIPKSTFTPDHQPPDQNKWVYPSEQQYFSAMRRKGYNPDEKDVPAILMIHNTVNEKSWAHIKEWETLAGCDDPKLRKFIGRPKDVSPKAFILHNIFGYALPFDRHDWIVDRNGKDVRYVIDFYTGPPQRHAPVSMHLDVRPALDSVSALFERLDFTYRMLFRPFSMPSYQDSCKLSVGMSERK